MGVQQEPVEERRLSTVRPVTSMEESIGVRSSLNSNTSLMTFRTSMSRCDSSRGFEVSRSLASGTCYIFRRGDGSEVEVNLPSSRPAGISFSKRMPLAVKAVAKDSAADELGVQVGWILEQINGIPVSELVTRKSSTS